MKENWLKLRLDVLGIDRQELVDRLHKKGIKRSPQTISNWMNGNPIPLLSTAKETAILAEVLDWTVTEMLIAADYPIQTQETDIPPDLLPVIMQAKRLSAKRLKWVIETLLYSIHLWENVQDDEMPS